MLKRTYFFICVLWKFIIKLLPRETEALSAATIALEWHLFC